VLHSALRFSFDCQLGREKFEVRSLNFTLFRVANQKYAKRKFTGSVLVSDNESWVRIGRLVSTGVMTAWETFVTNQRKSAAQHQPNGVSRGLAVAPKLINIDLQPYQTFQTSNFAFQTS
jgi:hypothetical protein